STTSTTRSQGSAGAAPSSSATSSSTKTPIASATSAGLKGSSSDSPRNSAERVRRASEFEDLSRVALADGATDIGRQRCRVRHRALHVMHLVRIVGPEEDAIGADDRDQVLQRAGMIGDAVVPDALQVFRRPRLDSPSRWNFHLVALVEAADQIGKR